MLKKVPECETQLARSWGNERMFLAFVPRTRNLGRKSRSRLDRYFLDYLSLWISYVSVKIESTTNLTKAVGPETDRPMLQD
jgi:hypothetical protein